MFESPIATRISRDRYPKDEKKGPTEPEPTKPRIRPGLYNQSVHQGESVNMQIAAEGFPVPTVRWFKDGQEIISDGEGGQRVIWTDERGFHHLVILNATPEVEGEYSVTATNEHGEAKSVGNVTVILPRSADGGDDRDRGGMPFPPGFIRQLKNKHVFTHLPTIFDCLVVGYPPPEVEWFHNGKRITEGPGVKIQSCRGGSHALLITDTTHDWAGEFVAKATNIHGSATSSAILDVTTPHMDELKFDGTFDITPLPGARKMNYKCLPTPPDYGPFIKEVTAHHLTLSWIPTKRSPPRYPQVTYVIEIRELPYKEWTLLEYNVPDPVCKVRNLELGKSYQFRVRAENIYGISDPSPASPPSRLMGPPQPVLDRYGRVIPLLDPYAERELDQLYGTQYHESPWFAPGATEKRSCAENDTISVTFCYGGFPDPNIKWLKSGHEVDSTSPTSNIRVSTRAGTETTLKISCFSRANAGMYQCVATNDHGEAVQKVQIDLANRPIFTQPLNDRTFSSGKPFRLDVRVEGEPEPTIIWQKDWHPLAESARVKTGPTSRSLLINNPMWRDSGVYSAYAVNPAGMATTSCTVTVEEDLDFESTAPKRRRKVELEQRNVRELYEIAEEDEKSVTSEVTTNGVVEQEV
ncbi:hypothetical protein M3Y99_00353500 [Aphelenchoides fujianensis]|nr:hypothetical protein M3Y99_00353500 [Aphelenchoides fujianensis]